MSPYWNGLLLLAFIGTIGLVPTMGADPSQPVNTEDDPFRSYILSTFKEAGAINTPELGNLLRKVISEIDTQYIIDFFVAVQADNVTEEVYQNYWSVNVRNCDKFRDHLEVFDSIIQNMKKTTKKQIYDMYDKICDLKAKGYNETELSVYLGKQAMQQTQTDPQKVNAEDDPFKSYMLSIFKEATAINVPALRKLLETVISKEHAQYIIDFFDAIKNNNLTDEVYKRYWSVNVQDCAAFRDHLEVFDPIIINMKKVSRQQIYQMYVTICQLKEKGYDEKSLADYLGKEASKQNKKCQTGTKDMSPHNN